MQRLIVVTVLALVAAGCGRGKPAAAKAPASSTEMSRAVVDPYLKIDAALASDSIEGVKAHAGEVATAATALGAFGVAISTSAVQLAAAGDLADARVKFGVLSEALDAYMSAQHLTPPAGIRVAFCPMLMKPWLQEDGPLRNPYYGSSMLTCGSFRN
jgi:hypothetical protein